MYIMENGSRGSDAPWLACSARRYAMHHKDTPKLVRGYFDHEAFGSGWRVLLLVRPGRRLVTIIEPSTLRSARVPLKDVKHLNPLEPERRQWQKIARTMAHRRRAWRKLGLAHVDRNAVKEAERLVKEHARNGC